MDKKFYCFFKRKAYCPGYGLELLHSVAMNYSGNGLEFFFLAWWKCFQGSFVCFSFYKRVVLKYIFVFLVYKELLIQNSVHFELINVHVVWAANKSTKSFVKKLSIVTSNVQSNVQNFDKQCPDTNDYTKRFGAIFFWYFSIPFWKLLKLFFFLIEAFGIQP